MWIRLLRVRSPNMPPVMTIEESRRTQRPYRYGMILLCFGALANWLGLAENYAEPVRYLGVACIIAGALLICTAMCCWLHTPQRTSAFGSEDGNTSVNVITVANDIRCEKPPDYDTVATLMPPSYDDAIKLNPGVFLGPSPTASSSTSTSSSSATVHLPTTTRITALTDANKDESSVEINSNNPSRNSSGHPPPIYTITTVMPNEVVTYDNEVTSNRSPASAPVVR